jgi:hypothetical protein
MVAVVRDWLSLHEAALVLQRPAVEVRNMLRRGEFTDVRPGRRRGVGSEQVSALIADAPIAVAVLEAILDDRLTVRARDLRAQPPSLMESWDAVR